MASDRGWQGDEMVPLDPDRVREAFQLTDLTVSEVARRAGQPQPIVTRIRQGKHKKCRRSRREALERALGVWIGSLGGESEYQAPIEAPYQMRWIRLANILSRGNLRGVTRSINRTTDKLAHLSRAFWWRCALTQTVEPPAAGSELADLEKADIHLSKAFEIILRPVCDDTSKLNGASLDRIHAAFKKELDRAIPKQPAPGPPRRPWPSAKPATARQRARLRELGEPVSEDMTDDEARELIAIAGAARATRAQLKRLREMGAKPPAGLTRKQAARLIKRAQARP